LELWEAQRWLVAGELGAAEASIRSSRERFFRLTDLANQRRAAGLFARIVAERGRVAEALPLVDGAIAGMEADSSECWDLGVALARRARIRRLAGDPTGAEADLARATALGRAGTYDRPGGDLQVELASVANAS